MNTSQTQDVKIKVVFGKDIRRWHCPEKNRYDELMLFVEKTFQLKTSQEFQIQYEDLEMDHITLSNEQDFEDALACALEQNRKSLKLYVVKKNREQDEDVQVEKKEKKDNKVETIDRCSSEASSHQSDGNCRKTALEFLLNEEVKKLLPELARDVVRAMNESNNVGGAALLEVVQGLLSADKYAPIVCHEFYQDQIRNQMPIWLTKIAPFSTMLLNLNEESVMLIVSNAINTLTISMASENYCQGNNQMWSPLSLLMGGLQQGTSCGWGSARGNFCGTGSEEVIHQQVQCDGCGVQPIRGLRYKCMECPNYDLCSKCEEAKKHPNHQLTRIESSEFMNLGHWRRNRDSCKRRYNPQAEWVDGANNEPIYGIVKSIATKTWQVKNTGEEEWGEDIELGPSRGHVALALEKRYRVPKAKPQETVQVTAAIRIPDAPGLYPIFFRLQKNGQQFGPKLWVDLCALADNERDEKKEESKPVENKPTENKPEPKVETKPEEDVEENKPAESKIVVRCICGEAMVETTPMAAYYETAEVNCDICGESCSESTCIYHCYSETNHPKGYDICLDCAYNQESLESEAPKKEPKKEEPTQSKEVQTSSAINNPFAGFQYEKEARDIMEMGFNDVLVIKELLVRLKGNVNEALGELIQQ